MKNLPAPIIIFFFILSSCGQSDPPVALDTPLGVNSTGKVETWNLDSNYSFMMKSVTVKPGDFTWTFEYANKNTGEITIVNKKYDFIYKKLDHPSGTYQFRVKDTTVYIYDTQDYDSALVNTKALFINNNKWYYTYYIYNGMAYVEYDHWPKSGGDSQHLFFNVQ
jgi:hypothetical protein